MSNLTETNPHAEVLECLKILRCPTIHRNIFNNNFFIAFLLVVFIITCNNTCSTLNSFSSPTPVTLDSPQQLLKNKSDAPSVTFPEYQPTIKPFQFTTSVPSETQLRPSPNTSIMNQARNCSKLEGCLFFLLPGVSGARSTKNQ